MQQSKQNGMEILGGEQRPGAEVYVGSGLHSQDQTWLSSADFYLQFPYEE